MALLGINLFKYLGELIPICNVGLVIRESRLGVFQREGFDEIGALLADVQDAYMGPLFGKGTNGGQSYATCTS